MASAWVRVVTNAMAACSLTPHAAAIIPTDSWDGSSKTPLASSLSPSAALVPAGDSDDSADAVVSCTADNHPAEVSVHKLRTHIESPVVGCFHNLPLASYM